jgi:very-short-patch-repair endonuclease
LAPSPSPRDVVHPDRALSATASDQHAVVEVLQLRSAGLSPRAIERRAESGALHRIHRGVYAVGHLALPPLARYSAALLACGPHAVLSHRSAAAVLGLLPEEEGAPIHVSLRAGQRRHRAGIRVHRPRLLPSSDVRRRDGLAVTSATRTVLDLTSRLTASALEQLVAEVLVKRMARPEELLARGTGRLRALVEAGPRFTRAESERRLLAIVDRANLPRPETNVPIAGYEVDLLWREAGVAVEVDGFSTHGFRSAFEHDHRRDLAVQATGLRTVRITCHQLEHEPLELAAAFATALALARGSRI